MRELLYNIECSKRGRLQIGISYMSCYILGLSQLRVRGTRGVRLTHPLQNVGNYCIGQLSGWVQVVRLHKAVMSRRVVLGEVDTEVSADGFPINEKLALPGAVLDRLWVFFV